MAFTSKAGASFGAVLPVACAEVSSYTISATRMQKLHTWHLYRWMLQYHLPSRWFVGVLITVFEHITHTSPPVGMMGVAWLLA